MRAVLGPALLAAALLASPPAHARDQLVIGVSQYPSGFHPDIDPEAIKGYVLDFVTRPITTFDQNWRLACLLCVHLPSLDDGTAKTVPLGDGRTGMTVAIDLRPDLAWGDGVPVTTRDLVFTWQAARDPASGFDDQHGWSLVSAIDVIDDRRAVLHLDRTQPTYAQWGTLLPAHIEGPVRAAAPTPAAYLQQTTYNRAPLTPGLWNGPYVLSEVRSGSAITLTRNPHWAGPTGFPRIVIRTIGDTAALAANLLSGDVDMIAGEGIGLTIDQVLELQRKNPTRFAYIFKPSLAYEHIDLAGTNPIFADVRVRRALLLATDRATMTRKLFGGRQPVADDFVNPLDPVHDPDVAHWPYDPARARALLAEAGWTPGPDGICRNAAGDRLVFTLQTTAGNRLRELVEQVLQSGWRANCIETTIRNEAPRTLFGQTLKHREFDGAVMYTWSFSVSASPRGTLGSDRIPSPANNWGGSNYVGFSNPAVDRDIDAIETALDPTRAQAAWNDVQRIYADRLPILPLYFRADPHVIPTWLRGYAPTGHIGYTPLWAENWREAAE